jgi:5-methylcytosine-specific restriction endonuclease McrA
MPVKACAHGHGYYRSARCPTCEAERYRVRDWRRRRKIKSGWEWGRIRAKVHSRDRVCVICGGSEGLQVHHRVPLAQGGSNALWNLELRCQVHHRGRVY